MYLHKCLGVVTSPLLEVPAIRKASEPCKRWGQCYAIINSVFTPISIKNKDLPLINVVKYPLCFCHWVFRFDPFIHPCNEMVLEATFNQLMQNVGCQKLMNICSGKSASKGLEIIIRSGKGIKRKNIYNNISNKSILIP